MEGLDGRRLMEHPSAIWSFNLSRCITRIWSSTSRSLRWSSMKPYSTRKHSVKNLGPRSWSSQAGGAKPQDTGDSLRTEGQQDHGSCQGCWNPEVWNATLQILKDVTRDFASTELIWQKNWKRTSTIGRSHWRHEQGLKSLEMLKIYWPLEDQTPVIYLC